MIESLRIANLGVIAAAGIDLGPGLTVVTGETGAGKTLFITALNLLTGARSEAGMVRVGTQKAEVEGIFDIESAPSVGERVIEAGGDAEDGELIVTRTLPAQGRARATAGGRTVPASVLRDIGSELVSMHGQSEQLTLRSETRQRELLDAFGGAATAAALARYIEADTAFRELRDRHERLLSTQAQRQERIAFLEKALSDIEHVRPVAGEDAELARLSARLTAAEELTHAVESAAGQLVGSDQPDEVTAVDLLNQAASQLSRAAERDETLHEHAQSLAAAALSASDVASELSAYLSSFDDLESLSLEELQVRRAQLSSLQPYGEDLTAVLAFETAAGAELLDLERDSSQIEEMDALTVQAEDRRDACARDLSEARATAARAFSDAVTAELDALSMPHATVDCLVTPTEPNRSGADRVSIVFGGGSGSALGDIGRVASGGELSRVMLAIEVVMADSTRFPTFIFDEIDAGVGGRAAIQIGNRLARLSQHSQVIVVTHLAQVAAWADSHVIIEKDDDGDGAVSGVRVLDDDERREELARMLGGLSDSASAQAHAEELLEIADEQKSGFSGKA